MSLYTSSPPMYRSYRAPWHPDCYRPSDLAQQVERALAEDIGSGDVTAALIPKGRGGRATVISREAAILCGMPYVNQTFAQVDPAVQVHGAWPRATPIAANQVLFTVKGPARALLTGERTALNFLQLLSGTARPRMPMSS